MNAKYKVNDSFIHKDKKILMIIRDIYQTSKGNLYTLFCPSNEGTFKRYYENKIEEVCAPLENSKMAQILYGSKLKRK